LIAFEPAVLLARARIGFPTNSPLPPARGHAFPPSPRGIAVSPKWDVFFFPAAERARCPTFQLRDFSFLISREVLFPQEMTDLSSGDSLSRWLLTAFPPGGFDVLFA